MRRLKSPALLHTPRIIFLDGPTLGLDRRRAAMWSYLRTLNAQNATTIFSPPTAWKAGVS
jgi:ABC-type multidrug transport system ATPase subunit